LECRFPLPGAENRIDIAGGTAQAGNRRGDGWRQLHGPGFPSFAENSNLRAFAVRLKILPREAAKFAHPDPGGIEQQQHVPIPRVRLETQDAVYLRFRQNPFGQAVTNRRQAKYPANIKGQITEPVTKTQEGFDRGKNAVLSSRGEVSKGIGKILEIGKR
jgi:hypothetical protein